MVFAAMLVGIDWKADDESGLISRENRMVVIDTETLEIRFDDEGLRSGLYYQFKSEQDKMAFNQAYQGEESEVEFFVASHCGKKAVPITKANLELMKETA